MRDIRKDLPEHLEAAETRRQEVIKELQGLELRIRALQALVRLDAGTQTEEIPHQRATVIITPTIPPSEFILKKMANGKPWALADLRDAAIGAGFFKGAEAPGRAAMGTLMSLKNKKKVVKVGDKWTLMKKASQ